MIRLAANGIFQQKIPGRVKTLPYSWTITVDEIAPGEGIGELQVENVLELGKEAALWNTVNIFVIFPAAGMRC